MSISRDSRPKSSAQPRSALGMTQEGAKAKPMLTLPLLSLLVVEPTHLKNILVKMGSSSPSFGVNIKKCLKSPPTVVVVVVDDGFLSNVFGGNPQTPF